MHIPVHLLQQEFTIMHDHVHFNGHFKTTLDYRKYPCIRRTFFQRGKNQKLGVRLIRRYSPGLPHATCGPAVVDSPMLRHVRRVTFDRFARKFVTRPDLKIKIDSTCAAGADCERQQNQSTIKRRYPCVKIKCVK